MDSIAGVTASGVTVGSSKQRPKPSAVPIDVPAATTKVKYSVPEEEVEQLTNHSDSVDRRESEKKHTSVKYKRYRDES